MKSYMETKKAVKEMICNIGIENIKGGHIIMLKLGGHDTLNVQNAISYFRFSPKTAKYR